VPRQLSLDNLKVILIAAVIAIHGALSYAGLLPVWTYSDVREVTFAPVVEMILLVAVSPFGLFMMTLLFLVSGLLSPASLERKGRPASPGTGCSASVCRSPATS
jgi:glucans biosynthesis protein C